MFDHHNGGHGHVGFFHHLDGDRIYILGGNQREDGSPSVHNVSVSGLPRRELVGYRWPVDSAPIPQTTLPTIRDIAPQDHAGGQTRPDDTSWTDQDFPGPAGDPAPHARPGMQGDNFARCLEVVLGREGGPSDRPSDHGGATKYGITHITLADWLGRKDVSRDEVYALTREDATRIYRAKFWNPIGCERLPPGIALMAFDHGVNAGPGEGVICLHQALNDAGARINETAHAGNATFAAVEGLDESAVIEKFAARRESFYRARNQPVNLKGWLNRVRIVKNQALLWAREGVPETKIPANGKTMPGSDMVTYGATGAVVAALQQALVRAGYSLGAVDGEFGILTQQALLAFQEENGLEATGDCDAATWEALNSAKPRRLSPDRTGADAGDLLAKGSKTIRNAGYAKITAWISSLLGALGIGNSALTQYASSFGGKAAGQTLPFDAVQQAAEILKRYAPANEAKIITDAAARLVDTAGTGGKLSFSPDVLAALLQIKEQLTPAVLKTPALKNSLCCFRKPPCPRPPVRRRICSTP